MKTRTGYIKGTDIVLAIGVGLFLMGCSTTVRTVPVVEIRERKIEIPKSLLSCSPEPVAGTVWVSQKDVARYLVRLAEAGEDCRLKLAAVKRLVDAR